MELHASTGYVAYVTTFGVRGLALAFQVRVAGPPLESGGKPPHPKALIAPLGGYAEQAWEQSSRFFGNLRIWPGPILAVELVTTSRRTRYFVLRVLYAAALFFALWCHLPGNRRLGLTAT